MVESQASRNRRSEKLWDDFPGSFHMQGTAWHTGLASVHINVCPLCRGTFALASLGGIHLSREVWMANEGTAFLAILAALRGWVFFFETKAGTDNFLAEIFCQAGLLFLHNSTPPPPTSLWSNFWRLWHMYVGLYLSLPDVVDAKICLLLGEIYKHVFLLDRNKEPQIFSKGRKRLPDARLQMWGLLGFFFLLAFLKFNNYTGHIYPEEGPQFSS